MKFRVVILVVLTLVLAVKFAWAQVSSTITVNGELEKYYPVTFLDGAFNDNKATELEIGRSSVHRDSSWRGALIAKFRYHTYNWGNGANFIDADIRQSNINNSNYTKIIGGWLDVTYTNSDSKIIIWLRGNTTYSYTANTTVSPAVYDGVQHPLPYQQTNGGTFSFKTAPDANVNYYGMSYSNTAFFNGSLINFFNGSVGIGTTDTKGYKLAVNGNAVFTKVKVAAYNNWPDYVFDSLYTPMPLDTLEQYVKSNKHLPEVPAAAVMEKEGLDLGDMNKTLMQKVEELTLYLIEENRKNKVQQEMIDVLKKEVEQLKAK